ncbi:MAG TPA: hypothetical protein DGT23_25980 [Micromonosporaceae bacterium]|nr:hypothetical protein [Micromonosporaceae bacterium]
MTYDRGNSKHGPWLDDELANEVEPLLRGRPNSGRVGEWREPEPAADGEPDASWAPLGHHGIDTGDDRDPDRREERARIGSYLPRSIFPADRDRVIEAARANGAPDQIISTLEELEPGLTLQNAQEFWRALDLPSSPRF